jgi:hypothetical protein
MSGLVVPRGSQWSLTDLRWNERGQVATEDERHVGGSEKNVSKGRKYEGALGGSVWAVLASLRV